MAEQADRITLVKGLQSDTAALIDKVERVGKRIDRGVGGREIALAKTKLQEAQYWLRAAEEAIATSNG